MNMLLRTRPRRAAAVLVVVVGGLFGAGAATTPAKAECIRASVWIYHSQQGEAGRDYQHGPYECVGEDWGWTPDGHHGPFTAENDLPPQGTPSGAGVEVWMASPA